MRAMSNRRRLTLASAIRSVRRDQNGFREFTNEMQHPVLGVLQWDDALATLILNSAVKLPDAAKPASRFGKSRQLWIARHRAWLGS